MELLVRQVFLLCKAVDKGAHGKWLIHFGGWMLDAIPDVCNAARLRSVNAPEILNIYFI